MQTVKLMPHCFPRFHMMTPQKTITIKLNSKTSYKMKHFTVSSRQQRRLLSVGRGMWIKTWLIKNMSRIRQVSLTTMRHQSLSLSPLNLKWLKWLRWRCLIKTRKSFHLEFLLRNSCWSLTRIWTITGHCSVLMAVKVSQLIKMRPTSIDKKANRQHLWQWSKDL